MDALAAYTLLLDELKDLTVRLETRLPYVAFSLVEEETLRVWRAGRRAGVAAPLPETGIVLRIWDGMGFHEFGTNAQKRDEIADWARGCAASVRVRGKETLPRRTPAEEDFRGPFGADPQDVPLATKIADVQDLHACVLGAHEQVTIARVTYEETALVKAFVDRDRRLTQDLRFVGVTYAVFASDGRSTRHAMGGNKLAGGYELFDQVASDDAVRQTVTYARDALLSEPVPPGWHTLVTAPLVSATVAHEAFGHGVEMDMVLKGCARAGAYFGKPVASPLVTMYDSPLLPNSAGFSFFDDEGELACSTTVIDKGVLRHGLIDAYSASKLGLPRSPNGRRESFRRKVYSRMSNTYFAPGDSAPEEILASTDRGIYLCGGGIGMEDPLGWGMQIDIRLGLEIRKGALTGRVFSPVVLTGYVPDLLTSISAVGSDLATYGFGKCGKTFRKDWILVGMGGPTLRMEGRLA
jgi:TldD protein